MSAKSWCTLLLMPALSGVYSPARAAEDKAWATAPYRVRIYAAVDSSTHPGALPEDLVGRLEKQIHRTLFPFWKTEVTLCEGAQRTTLLRGMDRLEEVEGFDVGTDKTLYLTVKADADGGFRLASREQDMLTGVWSPVLTSEARQELLLVQTSWEILWETFAPRAQVLYDLQQSHEAELAFQGADLMPAESRSLLDRPQSVFKPYMVRTNRGGGSIGKVIEVPWTYVVTSADAAESRKASVYSGSRRPFGARRRAGIDIVALRLQPTSLPTNVRFHASHEADQPLAGYEVFAKSALAAEFEPAGFTDENGQIDVRGRDYPVVLVALRSNAQPLVQVPVVPGAIASVDIPVSDDSARLMVQETLTTFTEQMVDVVARRNILMARARDRLKQGKQREAKELLAEIGNLPTRANMDRFLATLERDPGSRSKNPRVQAKIDQLFTKSRELMSTYLTTRELLELESEINNSVD